MYRVSAHHGQGLLDTRRGVYLTGVFCSCYGSVLIESKTLFLSHTTVRPQNLRHVLALQRHFGVLTKFTHVESRLSGCKRQREVVFYTSVNLCDKRACSASVAVGLVSYLIGRFCQYEPNVSCNELPKPRHVHEYSCPSCIPRPKGCRAGLINKARCKEGLFEVFNKKFV
jgi:hypothetical protein